MSAAAAAPPGVSESDPESLARYLRSFDWPQRNAAVEEMIIAGGLPLWREILRFVPQPPRRGRLLELGSPPFHTTLLAQRFRDYEIATTAGVIDDRRRLLQRVRSADFADEHEFDCACFDLEHERFPFDDASFDAVMFCEVIEHLTENPVFTLSEIHRVLRPGGWLLISTPNAARSGNLLRLFFGGNVFDQYHLGAPLKGSRHSREYTLRELGGLVAGTGFRVEVATGRNLGQIQYTRRTRRLEPLFRLFTLAAPGNHADHLFVRAVKDGPFRWHFPLEIFDEGHLRGYFDVRDPEVVVGANDVPHTTGPWGPLRESGGTACRAVGLEPAAVIVRAAIPAGAVEITFAPGPMPARVTAAVNGLGTGIVDLDPGMAGKLRIELSAPVRPGAEVRVEVSAIPEALLAGVRLLGC
jgi:SAM-dependent methyltransferase